MDVNLLVKVTTRAWAMDILALLHQGVAGRQAPLLAASGAGRTAFGHSLAHLVALGLLERNPGHGHPLRPEFRLTQLGQRAAAVAYDVMHTAPDRADGQLLRRSWTLPVLAVSHRPRRFSEMKTDLGAITDRALSHTLDQLQDRCWIARDVDVSARPLRPLYRAANAGVTLSQILRAG